MSLNNMNRAMDVSVFGLLWLLHTQCSELLSIIAPGELYLGTHNKDSSVY